MIKHTTKQLVIKNIHTGKVENIRSKHNYFGRDDKDRRREEKRIKAEFEKGGSYKVLKVHLGS